jgi:tRNA dimethylallyltransferase
MKNSIVLIVGPTGVGKTAFSDILSEQLASEIVNVDVGQLYTPLTIGTAKPDWKNAPIAHHLFDIIDEPCSLSVVSYRQRFVDVVQSIWRKNATPLAVGGSGFYAHGLFFPPTAPAKKTNSDLMNVSWEQLFQVDPVRAQQIHPHDIYRIQRALEIWYQQKIKPSEFLPAFTPVAPAVVVIAQRTREQLYEMINERTIAMIEGGWIDEVARLCKTPWAQFLKEKKLIGYDDIINFCCEKNNTTKKDLVACIQKKTRNYAKRQCTYFGMLSKKLRVQDPTKIRVIEIDLTHASPTLYINQVLFELDVVSRKEKS